jgi:hypothetical protein
MHPDNEILIDYLDKQLAHEKSAEVEHEIQNDTTVAGELHFLVLAVDTVRLNAISQKVFSIRKSITKPEIPEKPVPAVVRSIYKVSLRVAAVIILVMGIAALYKYVSVNRQSLYEKQFTGYELTNTRGQEINDAEEDAYQDKKWQEVISIYKAKISQSNKQSFLAAMAEMQLNHFPQAISLFENILNKKSGDNTFQEEAEYFSSLAYLMNHEENKAVRMINKIKANASHTYYPLVSNISSIDLKIIELKK